MQNQIYYSGLSLQRTRQLCDSNDKLADGELKNLLMDMAAKIEQMEKQRKDASIVQDNMHQKIRNKMVQIEERRKAWDDMMAEIFNEKERITVALKAKMERIDNFQKQTKMELAKLNSKLVQQVKLLNQDRTNIRLIMKDKIEKLRDQFTLQLQKRYQEIKKCAQDEEAKKQFKFTITCKQLGDLISKQKGVKDPEQKQAFKIEDVQQKFEQNFCSNIKVVVKNMVALEELQGKILELDPTIIRFEDKILRMGSKLQVIEEKIADLFFQKKKLPDNSARNNQKKFLQGQQSIKKYLMTNAKFFNQFLIEGNVITYVGDGTESSCIILGNEPLKRKPSFCIEVVHSANNYISVGMVDQNYHGLKDCWQKQNFVLMRGVRGEVYCGPSNKIKQSGADFKNGDQVRLQVNFQQLSVLWYINNVLRTVYKSKKLLDESIAWVPVIRFYNHYDSVKWLG